MVMHRALFTWFIFLVFFILLCLRLEARTHWNWFLIFLPMWIYNFVLLIDALFHLAATCVQSELWELIENKDLLNFFLVVGLIVTEIMLCLKLEYKSLELIHVLIPFWILLSLMIVGLSYPLFRVQY